MKRFLSQSRWTAAILILCVEALLSFVSYQMGPNVSFALFHVLLVAFAGWYISGGAGKLVAAVAIALWFTNVYFWSHGWQQFHWNIVLWSIFERTGIYSLMLWIIGYARLQYIKNLKHAEEQYTRIIETAMEGIVEIDHQQSIISVNESTAHILGYTSKELVGKEISALVQDPPSLLSMKELLFRRSSFIQNNEIKYTKKDGSSVWALTAAKTFETAQMEQRTILMLMDITERKQAERNLQQRYEEISATHRLWSTLAQSLQLEDRLQFALDAVLNITHFDAGCIYLGENGSNELILRRHRGFSPEFIRDVSVWSLGDGVTGMVAQNGTATFLSDASEDTMFTTTAGAQEKIKGFASIPLFAKETVVGVLNLAMHREHHFSEDQQQQLQTLGKQIGVSLENARLYENLFNREEEVKNLTQDIIQLQEGERRRFARELHDGLSQMLTSIKLSAELTFKNLSVSDAVRRSIEQIILMSEEAQLEAKRIAYDLSPPVLEDFGLVAGVRLLAQNFERRTSIAIELDLPPSNIRFDTAIESNVYRIVQEAVGNVVKYAAASTVSIQLFVRGGMLAVSIIDNGKGFDPSLVSTERGSGLGFKSMKERALILNGTIQIDSTPGRGTEIFLEIPLQQLNRNNTRSGTLRLQKNL
ncbi:MAG: PAS domain S-box protein [Bacteroidota bacterium]